MTKTGQTLRLLTSIGPTCTIGLGQDGKVSVSGAGKLETAQRAALEAVLGRHLPEEAREGLQSRRLLVALLAAPSLAVREVLTLPVAWWAGLPIASTLLCRTRGENPREFVATGAFEVFQAAKANGLPVFAARELDAMALGVEAGRARSEHMRGWLAAKAGTDWSVTPTVAGVADLPGYDKARRPVIDFGELFDALGVELVGVELNEKKQPGEKAA